MLNFLTSRQALAATTSVAALCLGVVITLPMLRDAPEVVSLPPAIPAEAPAKPGKAGADNSVVLAGPDEGASGQRARTDGGKPALDDQIALTEAAPVDQPAPPPPPAPTPPAQTLPATTPPEAMTTLAYRFAVNYVVYSMTH